MIQIDLPMPNSCMDCHFKKHYFFGEYMCMAVPEFFHFDLEKFKDKRLVHCPLKEVPTGKWNDINNSLPIVGMNVLVCDEDGDIYLTHRSYGGVFFNEYGDKIKDIRAWQPLPKSYVVEEQQGEINK